MRSVSLLLLIMLGLMVGGSLHKKLAYDEYPNLYYGYRFLTEGPSAVADGQRMPVMALYALGCVSYQCDSTVLDARPAARMIVRLPGFLLALLLGFFVYLWARELYGTRAGLFALALYVFNPNFIAHGKEITSDTATSLFFFLSVYFFWKYSKGRRISHWLLCAVTTAATIVSKYSGLLIFAVLGLLWGIEKIKKIRQGEKPAAGLLKSSLLGFGFGFIVLILINVTYLFNGTFTRTNEYTWQSKSYQKLKPYALPVPFPKTFTLGLDYTSYVQENPAIGRGNNYILGKRHRRGRWYSFPIMILLKTPIGFFFLLPLAACAKKREGEDSKDADAFLFIPFLFWLIIFSVLCDLQLGVRYVLPAFLFLILYAAKSVRGNPSVKALFSAGLMLGWYISSSVSYFPHFISYFNETIGRRINAYKYLSDSNLDWEDKSFWIDAYIRKHPELQAKVTDGKDPQSGFLIVGANDYTGVMDEARTTWLREYKPLTSIGYSHYLFYVPPSEVPHDQNTH